MRGPALAELLCTALGLSAPLPSVDKMLLNARTALYLLSEDVCLSVCLFVKLHSAPSFNAAAIWRCRRDSD